MQHALLSFDQGFPHGEREGGNGDDERGLAVPRATPARR